MRATAGVNSIVSSYRFVVWGTCGQLGPFFKDALVHIAAIIVPQIGMACGEIKKRHGLFTIKMNACISLVSTKNTLWSVLRRCKIGLNSRKRLSSEGES